MFFWGAISILQIAIIPGYFLSKAISIREQIGRVIFILCSSLLINFLLVFGLTAIGLYNRSVLQMVLLAELACFGYLYWRKKIENENGKTETEKLAVVKETADQLKVQISLFLFFLAAGYLLLLAFKSSPIFSLGDSVVSWNKWAQEWAQNRLPEQTWLYPQLLPANWSISYVLMGNTEINFFSKFIMYFFPFGILLIFWDLFIRTKNYVFLLAGALTIFLLTTFQEPYIFSGYVDTPLAFFCLAVFYFLFLALRNNSPMKEGVVASAIVFSGACLTKQPGMFMVFPFAIFIWLICSSQKIDGGKAMKILIQPALIIFLCVSPFYVYKLVQIYNHTETSNVSYLISDVRHQGKGLDARLVDSTEGVIDEIVTRLKRLEAPIISENSIQLAVVILLIICLVSSFFSFIGRVSSLMIGIPFYLIWSSLFSYDSRNISLCLPFLSIGIVTGAEWIFLKVMLLTAEVRHQLSMLIKGRIVTLSLLSFLLFSIGVSFVWSEKLIENKQVEFSRSLMGPKDLNEKIYELLESDTMDSKVLSNYWFLPFLPQINHHSVAFDFQNINLSDSLRSKLLNLKQPIKYVLTSKFLMKPELQKILDECAQLGELKNVYQQSEEGGWALNELSKTPEMVRDIREGRKEIHGQAEVNNLLYKYYEENGFTGQIVSNYFSYPNLPILHLAFRNFNFSERSGEELLTFLKDNKNIHYILFCRFISTPETILCINQLNEKKQIKALFQTSDAGGGWTLYEISR